MTLAVLATTFALVAAFAFGGRFERVGRPPLARTQVLALAVIAQATTLLSQYAAVYVVWLVLGTLAMGWFAFSNRGRPGLLLATAGLALNALVVVLNWGMPVSTIAAERAGVEVESLDLEGDPLRLELDDQTVLPWLGEAIPLALPVRPAVASVGDVLFGAGFGLFVFTSLTGRGRVVPDRPLTRAEKQRQRAERKRAKAEAQERAGAPPPLPLDEDPDLVPERVPEPMPVAAPVVAAEPVAASPERMPQPLGPEPVDDTASEPDTETEPEPVAVPEVDPVVLAAEQAKADAKRELKRARKRARRAKATALAATAAAPAVAGAADGDEPEDDEPEDDESEDDALGDEPEDDENDHDATDGDGTLVDVQTLDDRTVVEADPVPEVSAPPSPPQHAVVAPNGVAPDLSERAGLAAETPLPGTGRRGRRGRRRAQDASD